MIPDIPGKKGSAFGVPRIKLRVLEVVTFNLDRAAAAVSLTIQSLGSTTTLLQDFLEHCVARYWVPQQKTI